MCGVWKQLKSQRSRVQGPRCKPPLSFPVAFLQKPQPPRSFFQMAIVPRAGDWLPLFFLIPPFCASFPSPAAATPSLRNVGPNFHYPQNWLVQIISPCRFWGPRTTADPPFSFCHRRDLPEGLCLARLTEQVSPPIRGIGGQNPLHNRQRGTNFKKSQLVLLVKSNWAILLHPSLT